MTGPKRCNLPLEDLLAHLDGELDRVVSARVAEHLAGCTPCSHEAELLARAGAALAALPPVSPSDGFAERVLAAAGAVPATTAAAPATLGRMLRLWPAAAVAAALVTAFVVGRGTPDQPPTAGTDVATHAMTDAELEAIAADLPLLANLETLQDDDAAGLIALIDNLDILESVETESLDALDALIRDADDGG